MRSLLNILDIKLKLKLAASYIAEFPIYINYHLYIILLYYILDLLAHISYNTFRDRLIIIRN